MALDISLCLTKWTCASTLSGSFYTNYEKVSPNYLAAWARSFRSLHARVTDWGEVSLLAPRWFLPASQLLSALEEGLACLPRADATKAFHASAWPEIWPKAFQHVGLDWPKRSSIKLIQTPTWNIRHACLISMASAVVPLPLSLALVLLCSPL